MKLWVTIYEDQNQQAEALTDLQTAIGLNSRSYSAHEQLGLLYAAQKKYAEAVDQFKVSLRIHDDTNVKMELVSALTSAGKLDEAESTVREVLKARADDYRPNEELGEILALKKQYAPAIAAYKTEVRIWPDSPVAHRELCMLYQSTGQIVLSIEEGEIATLKDPENAVAFRYLARGYEISKDYVNSIKLYNRAIEIEPGSAASHLELAGVLFATGKKDEGRAEIKKALDLNPTEAEVKAAKDLQEKNP